LGKRWWFATNRSSRPQLREHREADGVGFPKKDVSGPVTVAKIQRIRKKFSAADFLLAGCGKSAEFGKERLAS
jgi:hypothetical protein